MELCLRCAGDCCGRYNVLVTLEDVRRIVEHSGEDPEGFLRRIPVGGVKTLMPDLRFGGGYYHLALRRGGSGFCVFSGLDEEGNGVCFIHDVKPSSCRVYPFEVRGGRLVHREGHKCPRSHPVDHKAESRVRGELIGHKDEVDAFHGHAGEWNRCGGGTWEEFLHELRKGYGVRKDAEESD